VKLLYSIYKEYKVLIRDGAGLAIMFIMPTILVFVVTMIQDSTFRSVNESTVPLLLVDRDNDSLGRTLETALNRSHFFKVSRQPLSDAQAKAEVAKGNYLIGIVVPAHTSETLRQRSTQKIETMLASFGGDSTALAVKPDTSAIHLQLYFDPVTKSSFKATISNAIERIVAQIEMQSMLQALNETMRQNFPTAQAAPLHMEQTVKLNESYASVNQSNTVPNSVQHNVPAWTMFAMFFICIPLAGNIIREREEGSAFRLLTMPGSYLYVMLGKMATYVLVSLIQFALMLCMGMYVLPLLGLPALSIGHSLFALLVVALASGLAATGFGLLVGTVATSQDQAALFGAVCVMIFAAVGGVWVPTFVMPGIMKQLSGLSPLNWGLESFYGIFLRQMGLGAILPQLLKLLAFFLGCLGASFYYQKYKRLA